MTDPTVDPEPLEHDDVRALLSDHIEGTLDDALRAQVDAALASDASLRLERARLASTMRLLSQLPDPEPPPDLVGRVRDRLAVERRQDARRQDARREDARSQPARPSSSSSRAPVRRFRFGIEAVIGLSCAAAVAVFVAVGGPAELAGGAGAAGTAAAGLSDEERVVSVQLVAPGFPRWLLTKVARESGIDTVQGDATYEGDGRAAARFLIGLKEVAVARGVEISGTIPEAARVRVTVVGD